MRVPSWRMVDVDRKGRKRAPRVVDPMEVVGLVVLALVAVSVAPRVLGGAPPAAEPRSTATPAPVLTSLRATLALAARPQGAGECGALSATTPASTFEVMPRAIRRVDTAVSIAADPWWYWCVAGARVYEDGIEVVGRLVPQGDPPNGQRPRPVLRSAAFSGQIEGYGTLGPAEIARTSEGLSLLRLRAVTDNRRRTGFISASDRAASLTLRLATLAGPWSFPTVQIGDGPIRAEAAAQGVAFQLRDLKVLADGIAMTTSLAQDPPDPALVTIEWDVADDSGTSYRARSDRPNGLSSAAVAFEPAPPRAATSLNVAIRRVYLTSLREFAVKLPLVP